MRQRIILLGSGGHAKVLLETLRRGGREIVGITDPVRPPGSSWENVAVLGDDSVISRFAVDDVILVNGIGSLPKDSGLRAKLYNEFVAQKYRFETVIDPFAIVAGSVLCRAGAQVMAGAIIQAGTVIAENAIINSGAIVEHDCVIGCHVHVAPGAVLSGNVEIGNNVHIGTGAVIIQGIRIGAGSIVGAGSVVTRDIGARQIVYPARARIQDIY